LLRVSGLIRGSGLAVVSELESVRGKLGLAVERDAYADEAHRAGRPC
jgi:hypothetical protein